MLTQSGTIKYKVLALALVVVLLTCWVSNPRQVKAADDLPTIEFTHTTLTPLQVKAELDAVVAPSLLLILGIVGFIAITYCVLRNVDIGIDYSNGTFFDKCQTVGQYMYQQLSDAGEGVLDGLNDRRQQLADIFYSVMNSIRNAFPTPDPDDPDDDDETANAFGEWGPNLNKFVIAGIGSFIAAMTAWLNSSLKGDSSTTSTAGGLISVIQSEPDYSDPEAGYNTFEGFRALSNYSYPTEFRLYWNSLNLPDLTSGIGYFSQYSNASRDIYSASYVFCQLSDTQSTTDNFFYGKCLILQYSPSNGAGGDNPRHYTLKAYSQDLDTGNLTPYQFSVRYLETTFSDGYDGYNGTGVLYYGPYFQIGMRAWNAVPAVNTSLEPYMSVGWQSDSTVVNSIRLPANTFGYGYLDANSVLNYLRNIAPYSLIGIMECDDFAGTQPSNVHDNRINWLNAITRRPAQTIPQDYTRVPQVEDVTVDIPDTATVLDPEAEKTAEQERQRRAIEDALATGTTTELANVALGITGSMSYDLVAAITDAISVDGPAPNPNNIIVPSLDDIWKYVRYTFNTLGGFIRYCGQCLDAVTVGEGGLSWFFYGAFIMFVCGGFISKLLL